MKEEEGRGRDRGLRFSDEIPGLWVPLLSSTPVRSKPDSPGVRKEAGFPRESGFDRSGVRDKSGNQKPGISLLNMEPLSRGNNLAFIVSFT